MKTSISKIKKKIIVLFFLVTIIHVFAFGQTWNGSVNTDWNTAGNWTPAAVPIETDRIYIPGSVASGNWPVLSANLVNLRINSIFMDSGSRIDFNGITLFLDNTVYPINRFYGATLNNSKETGINIFVGYGR